MNLFCAFCVELHLLSEPNSALTVLSLDLFPSVTARTACKDILFSVSVLTSVYKYKLSTVNQKEL